MFPAKLFDPWWRSSNISFLVTINLSSSSSSSLSSFAPHCRFIFNIVIPATPPSQHAVFSVVSSFFPFSFPQSVTSFFSSSAHHKSVPSPSPHRRDRLLNSPTSTSILDKLLWNSPPLSPCETTRSQRWSRQGARNQLSGLCYRWDLNLHTLQTLSVDVGRPHPNHLHHPKRR